MSNLYVPERLRIESHVNGRFVLAWDMDQSVAARAGVFYRLYMSNDGNSFELKSTVRGLTETVEVQDRHALFIRVSSVVPGLGESHQTEPIRVHRDTCDAASTIPVIDNRGDRAPMHVDDLGNLKIRICAGELPLNIPDVQTDSSDQLISAKYAINNVTTAGAVTLMAMQAKMILTNIRVTCEAGTCLGLGMGFTFELYNRSDFTRKIHRVFSASTVTDRIDIVEQIPYVSDDNLDNITARIIPNAGTDNDFDVVLIAKKAR